MKKVIYILQILLLNSLLINIYSQESIVEKQIRINISNIKQIKGKLFVALYDNEKDFLKKEKLGKIIPVNSNKQNLILKIPHHQENQNYAIAVFQDLDGNKKLSINWIGIPKEPYGFNEKQNKNSIGFGFPKWKDYKFSLKNRPINDINIHLKEI